MKVAVGFLLLVAILNYSYAPPVTQQKDGSKEGEDSEIKDDLEDYMEYHRYLKEVVQALESDSEFRDKLEKAEESDIRTGKIAEQLDFVNHNVRTKLDEIKRREMERLRHLATREYELTNNIDTNLSKVPTSEHLDHENPHTFEIEDLKKLIRKTTLDLAEADQKRREEFKVYEMQKEFEKHQKMEGMSEAEKKEYEEKLEKEKKVQQQHAPLHHPGSKQQLEEVWEKQDHMDNQEFNPKVFFMMHDVDGNGVWDADEVKALFVKELDKMYKQGVPNTDLRERQEEMERMREHVFKESDNNRDGLIDYNEFLMQTKRAEFERDQGWQGIDENQIYTPQEYTEFEKRRQEELRYLQERGLVDAHGRPIPGAHMQQPNQQQQYYQHAPQFQQQPQYQEHHYQYPNEVPPQYAHPGQAQHHGQAQMHPQVQMPHQGQMPYGQQPINHVPQGQIPQHAQPMPPQGHVQQDQVPQNQMHQGQVPHIQKEQAPQQGQPPKQAHPPPQGNVPPQHVNVPPQQGNVPQQHGNVPAQQGNVPQQQGNVPQQQGNVNQQHAPQVQQVANQPL